MVPYELSKISVAITKAFLAVEGGTAAASSRIHETVARLTEQVTATFQRRMPSGGTIHIEDVQDQVELSLMRAGEHKIARDYVIYREEQARKRAAKQALSPATQAAAGNINVIQLTAAVRRWTWTASTPLSPRPVLTWRMSAKQPSSTRP